jgi:hypothetical protein
LTTFFALSDEIWPDEADFREKRKLGGDQWKRSARWLLEKR